jgi:phosphoribosylformylglycinamidine cyclo-ligase
MSKMYEKSGVSIEAGERLVDLIKKDHPNIGGFSGLFPYGEDRYLVGCTDGVGTKLEISIAQKAYQSLGQDLVAMSVNDLLVCGARPLFFLDYYACGKLDVAVAHEVVKGISNACRQSGAVLLGGETAEMPGFYHDNKFDLAGFAVGEVMKADLIDGSTIVAGDVLVGLPSSGFHANGYSLIRHILQSNQISLQQNMPGTPETVGEILTRPTHLYGTQVNKAKSVCKVKGMSHITGGGLTNIDRVLPTGLKLTIDHYRIPTPEYMKVIQKWGQVSHDEAFKVWNMGMGYVFVVSASDAKILNQALPESFVFGIVN